VIAGIEFQGDAYFNGGFSAYDALALGRIGGFVSDNTMVYGELGGGFVNATPAYALGVGVEMAMTDQLSVRGELQGLGAFGAAPSTAKATVGLLWHVN
jgi:outer membrane immunogenic protein